MASLREIKTRIASVRSTLKITSAMKMISSAKLHKAQLSIGNKLPYERQLHRILAGILKDEDLHRMMLDELGFSDAECSPVILEDDGSGEEVPSKESVSRVALVLFSSNTSLIGAFNSNIIRLFKETLVRLEEAGYSKEDIDIYAVGRKIAEAARKEGFTPVRELDDLADKPDYGKASGLAEELVALFSSGKVSRVMMLYNRSASASVQLPVRENYLPLLLDDMDDSGDSAVDFIIEPDPVSLMKQLVPLVLMMKLYTVALDTNAAEHAARTLAMQVATDNAEKLLSELTLSYNKGRQQAITSEILDLVGGMQS
ncbi:MAG: ATP synthase F1 subunit gamma [Bacteroidales bacterium]|nr:ATP synthase F1 subunit gamma [Bacteroidales bacterium]